MTLLLRYPPPEAPHGPPSFVSDALYLRDNLLLDGGAHLITKYSNKSPETTVTRKLPKRIKRARTAEQEAAHNAATQISQPETAQDHGGIETILQEAAKGLYKTGERWGVAKAIRGAVQGIQASNVTPRRSSRRYLDSEALMKRVMQLEERNVALSKMLAKAMDELWTEQKDKINPGDGNQEGSDALSLAIAKVQFVQVYLENSTMQLPHELDTPVESNEKPEQEEHTTESKPEAETKGPSVLLVDGIIDEKPLPVRRKPQVAKSPSQKPGQTSSNLQAPSTPPSTAHKMRPSLSESPYSWMLGDEQPKSEFVSASPAAKGVLSPSRRPENLFGGERKVDTTDDGDVFVKRAKK